METEKSEKANGTKNSIVDNHRMAATHSEEAAKCHHEAAKHHEDGNPEKALQSTVKAQGHHCCAGDHQREVAKEHALNK